MSVETQVQGSGGAGSGLGFETAFEDGDSYLRRDYDYQAFGRLANTEGRVFELTALHGVKRVVSAN